MLNEDIIIIKTKIIEVMIFKFHFILIQSFNIINIITLLYNFLMINKKNLKI